MYRSLLAGLIILMGAVLAAGGIWLIALDGSWAYLLLGIGLLISGGLVLNEHPGGLSIYGIVLLGALIWGLWEVGLDWWALVPRGALLVVIGILLLPLAFQWYRRRERPHGRSVGGPASVLVAAVLIATVVGIIAMLNDPHDRPGSFDQARMNADRTSDVAGVAPGEWPAYGRTPLGRRYSPLDQITPENVAGLEVAWQYNTGEIRGEDDPGETTYEVTPIVVGDMMYVCTPFATVIALDPVTGEEIWRFDPQLRQPPTETTQHMTCRGVTYFDGDAAELEGQPTAEVTDAERAELVSRSAAEVTTEAAGVPQNVVTGLASPDSPNPQVERGPVADIPAPADCVRRLFVPTSDGRLIAISAETGRICPGFGGEDGTVNLWANMPNVTPGSHYSTSPPVATDRLIIVGGTVNDNVSTTSPSGVIRAFDAYTGELVWNFDPKRPEATEPIADGETYSENTPNSWSVSSWDPELGLVYIPMGVGSPDQWGGNRTEAEERFATSVLALEADTGEVAWVYQTVHHDIWDMDVPAQPSLIDLAIGGETVPALVQPTKHGEVFVLDRRTGEPVLPVEERPAPQGAAPGDWTAPTQPVSAISFNPERLEGRHMWGATLIDQLVCRIRFHQLRYEGRFTPPSLEGTLVYPGNFGTFNWGGVAVDPERQIMFGMPVYLAFTVQLVERPDTTTRVVTEEGDPIFNENFGAPFAVRMSDFRSFLGLPCQQPPWGYVAGVDLTTGETVYQHVNGTVRDLAPVPLPFEMGVPGIGGPIITGGGLAFLSGTLDYYVRGYDLATGEELWRARLPAGGQATPSTYEGRDGRQYLVVVAGGHGSTGTRAGDAIIAYALPEGG